MSNRKISGLGLPGWRWLALGFALVVGGAVATPILAQDVTVTHWPLPAHTNTIALDSTGRVWAGQYEGYCRATQIYRLDPATDELTTYTASRTDMIGEARGVAVDSLDNLWYTNCYGYPYAGHGINHLDPATGEVTRWPVDAVGYAVVVDVQDDVWFACGPGTSLCRFEPASGTLTTWTLPSAATAISLDALGRVWLVEANAMKVAMLDPATNTLSEWPAPGTRMSDRPGAIFAASDDEVWFAVWQHSDNNITGGELVRLNPATNEMTEWICPPTTCYGPSGVLVDGAGGVWFTERGTKVSGGSGAAHMQKLDPTADPPVFTRWRIHDTVGPGWDPENPLPDQMLLDGSGALWIHYLDGRANNVTRVQP